MLELAIRLILNFAPSQLPFVHQIKSVALQIQTRLQVVRQITISRCPYAAGKSLIEPCGLLLEMPCLSAMPE